DAAVDIALEATDGDFTSTGTSLAGNDYTLAAGLNATIGGAVTATAGLIDIDVSLQDANINAPLLAGTTIDIDAGQDINSDSLGTMTGPDCVTLTSGRDISLDAFVLSTGGDVTLTPNADVNTTAAATLTGENVAV